MFERRCVDRKSKVFEYPPQFYLADHSARVHTLRFQCSNKLYLPFIELHEHNHFTIFLFRVVSVDWFKTFSFIIDILREKDGKKEGINNHKKTAIVFVVMTSHTTHLFRYQVNKIAVKHFDCYVIQRGFGPHGDGGGRGQASLRTCALDCLNKN